MNIDNQYNNNNNGQLPGAEDDSDIFDIKKTIKNLVVNWYYFVGGLLITLLFAFIYIRYTDPVYQINAAIMVENESGGNSGSSLSGGAGMFQDLGGMFNMASSVNNEEEILRTRSLMYRVVKDLQLNVNYFRQEDIRSIETFENTPYAVHLIALRDSIKPFMVHWKEVGPNSYKLSDDKEKNVLTAKYNDTVRYNKCFFYITRNKFINIDKDAEDKFFFKISSYDNATSSYQRNLAITVPDLKANVMDLSINSEVPSKGEFVLNYFIQSYLQSSLEQRNQIADSTLVFINARLGIVTNELKTIETQIALYKGNNKIIDPAVQAQLMANTYDANYKLASQLDLQLAVIKDLQEYLKDEKNNKRIVPSNLVVNDITFTELVSKYNTLMIDRDRISLNYPETNPLLQNIDLQLSNIRRDMINNLSSLQANIQQSKTHLQINDQSLNTKIFGAPSVEKGYLELSREQKIKEALYLFLVQRREEIAISRSSNMAKAKVIDAAKATSNPVSPNQTIIYIAAIILGLFIPSIIIYLRSVLNTKILSKEDIIKKVRVPVLGEINHNNAKNSLIVTDQLSRSIITEQFRTLRTNLQFILTSKDQKTIMVTSSMGNEGKSFISLNLANVLALANNRVLLIELDLRKPKILKYLDISPKNGLSNYLISDIGVEEIVIPSGINENLFVAGSGAIPPNPTELLLSSRLADFFTAVKKQFDYIVIDSPPIGLVTDGQIIAKHANATLYIVRQKFTLRNQLNIIQDIHENKKISNLYILINDVKEKGSYGYGYTYGYGYAYGNGNGYFEKTRKNKISRLNKIFSK